jgi:hypothetical protein
LTLNGALSLVESTTTPIVTAGYGKIYLKSVSSYSAEDASTKLLISADGKIEDSSFSKKAISNIGGVSISPVSKFGSGSMYFNGSSYLQISNNGDFNFGTGDFTVDFWAKDLYVNHSTVVQLSVGPHDSLIGYPYNGSFLLYLSSPSAQEDIAQLVSMGGVPGSTWVHYAVVRSGNNFYTFKNGQRVSAFTSSLPVYTSDVSIDIGRYGSSMMIGYIDELRIVKGVAKWTNDFTLPSEAYPMTVSGNSFSPYFKDSVGNETPLIGSSGVSSVAGQFSNFNCQRIDYATSSMLNTWVNNYCPTGYKLVSGSCSSPDSYWGWPQEFIGDNGLRCKNKFGSGVQPLMFHFVCCM